MKIQKAAYCLVLISTTLMGNAAYAQTAAKPAPKKEAQSSALNSIKDHPFAAAMVGGAVAGGAKIGKLGVTAAYRATNRLHATNYDILGQKLGAAIEYRPRIGGGMYSLYIHDHDVAEAAEKMEREGAKPTTKYIRLNEDQNDRRLKSVKKLVKTTAALPDLEDLKKNSSVSYDLNVLKYNHIDNRGPLVPKSKTMISKELATAITSKTVAVKCLDKVMKGSAVAACISTLYGVGQSLFGSDSEAANDADSKVMSAYSDDLPVRLEAGIRSRALR